MAANNNYMGFIDLIHAEGCLEDVIFKSVNTGVEIMSKGSHLTLKYILRHLLIRNQHDVCSI